MKYIRMVMAYLLFLSAAQAQEAHSYSVFLSPKENVQQLQHPEDFLSERALLRREKQNIAVKHSDLPISSDRLKAIGDIVSYQGRHSKWLNSIYVEATAEEVVALSELGFVKDIVPVSGHTYTTTSINPVYDHGIAADQAHQITLVEGLHNVGYIGADMVIAVLDAGFVGANTVDFNDYSEIIATRNFVEGGTNVYQGSSHGFSVLSTMAADKNGVFVATSCYYLTRHYSSVHIS
jgi:serine protease AprX